MHQSYQQHPGFQSTHMNPQTAQTFQTAGQQLPYSPYTHQSFGQQQPLPVYGQQPFFQTGAQGFGQLTSPFQSYNIHQPVPSMQGMVTAPHQPYHLSNYQGNLMGHDRYLNQDAIIPSQRQYPQSGFAFGNSYGSH